MFDLVLKGRFVDPLDGEREGSVGIRQGVIEKVGERLHGNREIILEDSEILFPGFIDPHVHLREPGWEEREDFLSGTRAAVKGGVTTVVDMPNNKVPTTTRGRLVEKISLSRKAAVDVFFHGGVKSLQGIEEMKDLVNGYKVYLGQTTGDLLITAEECGRLGEALGRIGKPVVFHVSEPEEEGVKEARELGERHGFPVHIAHLSTRGGLRAARGVTSEVTPHHLLFTEEDRERNPFLVMKPPLGTGKDKRALLEAVKDGRVDMLATDHAPHLPEQKREGAYGLPGLEAYGSVVAWLLKEGVGKAAAARLTSYHAAQRFSLEGRGRIAEGYRADLAVLETGPHAISKPLASKCGWSPYEGIEFPGRVSRVILRGRMLSGSAAS